MDSSLKLVTDEHTAPPRHPSYRTTYPTHECLVQENDLPSTARSVFSSHASSTRTPASLPGSLLRGTYRYRVSNISNIGLSESDIDDGSA